MTLQHGHLTAVDTRTGRRLWRFGHNLGSGPNRDDDGTWDREYGFILVADERVFTHSNTGTVYAVSARTGRLLWSAKTGLLIEFSKNKYGTWKNFSPIAMDTSQNTFAITDGAFLVVYNASNGHELWRMFRWEADMGFRTANIRPNIILVEYYTSGTSMRVFTRAYTRTTGKPLWTSTGYADIKKSTHGRITLAEQYDYEIMNYPTWVHYQIRDEQTGALIKEYMTK